MESKFENSYLRTVEIHKEFYRYFFFKTPLRIACYILVAVNSVILILNKVLFKDESSMTTLGIALIILVIAIPVIQYFTNVKIMSARDQELNHGTPPTVSCTITDERIICKTEPSTVNEIELTRIKKVVKTKNLIILMTKNNICFVLKKDAFTKGSAEELLAFLKEKGLKV